MSRTAVTGVAPVSTNSVREVRAPGRPYVTFGLRAAIMFLFGSILYLSLFGIAVLPDFSVNFSLIAIYALLATLLAKKMVVIDIRAALLFLSCVLVGLASVIANSNRYVSISSFLLLVVSYFPFMVSIKLSDLVAPMRRFAMQCYCDLSLGLAVCAIAQFGLQFIFHAGWLFNLTSLIPGSLVASGLWNHSIPIAGGLFKANGFFQRESSGLSTMLGFAVLLEITMLRRYWRLCVLGLAMILSYSGSGIVIVLAGVLVPTRFSALGRAGVIMLSGFLFWLVFKDVLGLDMFLNRLNEFGTPNTSGYARFVAPLGIVQDGWSTSWWTPYLGNGPGTIQPMINRTLTTFAIHDPTWAKVIFEYGILGTACMVALILYLFHSANVPTELKLAMFYGWMASGGLLLSSDFLALMLGLIVLWRQPTIARTANTIALPLLRPKHTESIA